MRELRARLAGAAGRHRRDGGEAAAARRRARASRATGTEEALVDPTKFGQATVHFVQPGYFDVMRTRVVEGRTFTEADNRADVRDGRHRSGAGGEAVSRAVGDRPDAAACASGRQSPSDSRSIGVVEHQRHGSLARDGREAMFMPEGYVGFGAANRWAVRTSGDPSALSAVGPGRRRRGESARRRHRRPADAGVRRARAGADEVRAGADWHLRRHRARSWRRSGSTACCRRPSVSGRRRSACAWRSAPSTAGSSA